MRDTKSKYPRISTAWPQWNDWLKSELYAQSDRMLRKNLLHLWKIKNEKRNPQIHHASIWISMARRSHSRFEISFSLVARVQPTFDRKQILSIAILSVQSSVQRNRKMRITYSLYIRRLRFMDLKILIFPTCARLYVTAVRQSEIERERDRAMNAEKGRKNEEVTTTTTLWYFARISSLSISIYANRFDAFIDVDVKFTMAARPPHTDKISFTATARGRTTSSIVSVHIIIRIYHST